jgi:hypothetical protein
MTVNLPSSQEKSRTMRQQQYRRQMDRLSQRAVQIRQLRVSR